MRFADIRDRIVNNPGFRSLEEVKRAGYRIVKERNGERYFLVKPETLKPLLVRLGEVAEVRFGIKTGANEFFYLEPVGRTVKEVAELRERKPHVPVRVKNGAGWEGEIEAAWLRPVIKSLREIETLQVRLEDLRYLLFMPPEDVRECLVGATHTSPLQDYPLATAYIRWGKGQGYPDRPTCTNRQWWWDVGQHPLPDVIYSRRLGDRHLCPANGIAVVGDTLYELLTAQGSTVALLLSSTIGRLLLEREGRELTGAITVVELYIPDLVRAFIVDPNILTPSRQRLLTAFERLSRRPVRSIFEELGFALCQERRCEHPEHPYEHVQPEDLTLEQVRQASPDRFELDAVVFDVLGLTEAERLEVYRAVVQLVKERLVKARSV
jgi:hypothetical protein